MQQILSHTPAWVFALFAGLLAFGLLQTRTRNVKKAMAYALPAGMVALSLSGIQSSFGFRPLPVAGWAAGLALVTFIAYKKFPQKGMGFNRDSRSFHIPGSWAPLAVIMAIFFTKYLFAVLQGFGVAAASSPRMALGFSCLYGCFSGYFCARALSLAAAARSSASSSKPTPFQAQLDSGR